MNKQIAFFLAIFLVLAGFYAFRLASRSRDIPAGGSGAVVDPDYTQYTGKDETLVWDFKLTERNGRLFESTELADQVWVGSFFFASCPSTCRQQNLEIKTLHAEWAEQGVTFACISCDPDKDSPSALREYALQFTNDDHHWLFLTGNIDYVRRIAAERFGLPLAERTHADRLVVMDKWGNPRGAFNWHESDQLYDMNSLIEQLRGELQEPEEFINKRQQREETVRQYSEAAGG